MRPALCPQSPADRSQPASASSSPRSRPRLSSPAATRPRTPTSTAAGPCSSRTAAPATRSPRRAPAPSIGPDLDAAFAQARADGMDNDTVEGVVQTQIESPRYEREGRPATTTASTCRRRSSPARTPRTSPPTSPASPACPARSRRRSARPTRCSPRSAASATRSRPARASGVGPNLDDGLVGKDAAYIKQSIVDPNAVIAQGYPSGRHAAGLRAADPGQGPGRAWSSTSSTRSTRAPPRAAERSSGTPGAACG